MYMFMSMDVCMHVCMYVDNGISCRNHCSFCVYPGIYIRILETKKHKNKFRENLFRKIFLS